jgi:hypothetical protein
MLDWLLKNKEWVFSGAGVAVFGLVWRLLHKKTSKMGTPDIVQTIQQNPSLTQTPVIHNVINNAPPTTIDQKQNTSKSTKIFALSPWTGEKPAMMVDTLLSGLYPSLEVCLARFKLAADDPSETPHEFEASIEYVDVIHTNARPRTIENIVCRVNQARLSNTDQ